jgi:hypothetical protein
VLFFVTIDKFKSSSYYFLHGIPQESVLSPLLFILCTTTLITVVLWGGGQHIHSGETLVTYSTLDAEWVASLVFKQTLSAPPHCKTRLLSIWQFWQLPPETTPFQTILSSTILILVSHNFITFSLCSHLLSYGMLVCSFIGW